MQTNLVDVNANKSQMPLRKEITNLLRWAISAVSANDRANGSVPGRGTSTPALIFVNTRKLFFLQR